MPRILSCLAFALVLLVVGRAEATVAIQFDVAALTTTSDVVAVARVESRSAQWVGGRIVTDFGVRVTLPVAGSIDKGALLTVRTAGGRVDDLAQVVHGVPGMVVGEDVLLFLERPAQPGVLRVVGMAQGRFSISRDAQGEVWVAQELRGLTLAKITGEDAAGKKRTTLLHDVRPIRMKLRRLLAEVDLALVRVDEKSHPDVRSKLGPEMNGAYDFADELGGVAR